MSAINTNEDRAERARFALDAYKANDWRGRRGANEPTAEEVLEAVGDLLGDLHHLVDRTGVSDVRSAVDAIKGRDSRWDQLVDRGEYHYSEEVAEEQLPDGVSFLVGEAAATLARLRSVSRGVAVDRALGGPAQFSPPPPSPCDCGLHDMVCDCDQFPPSS